MRRIAAELQMQFNCLRPRLPRAEPLQVVTDVLTVPRALYLLLPGHVVPLQVQAAVPSAQIQVQHVVVGRFNCVSEGVPPPYPSKSPWWLERGPRILERRLACLRVTHQLLKGAVHSVSEAVVAQELCD